MKSRPIREDERIGPTREPDRAPDLPDVLPNFRIQRCRIPLPAAVKPTSDRSSHRIPAADWFYAHLLRYPEEGRAARVFLFVNGLNEVYDWDLYLSLAEGLLGECKDAVCILLPSPFHLDRYPNQVDPRQRDVTVLPLDVFSANPIELWYMYQRQMTEIRLVLNLLHGPERPELALQQLEQSQVFDARRSTLVDDANTKLRSLIAPEPRIYLTGFSLGGLTALSTLFANPRAVDGAVAICSGASLESINPVKLCETEEWQTLLRTLRIQMDAEGCDRGDDQSIREWRVFSETFLRSNEYTFRARLEEFKRRVLFVIGGQDPVVPLDSVTRSVGSPGASILSLAEVRHFVNRDQAWSTWSDLTTAAIVQASRIASSNSTTNLRRGPHGMRPHRLADDLLYLAKLLRATTEDFRGITSRGELREALDRDWIPEDVRIYGKELVSLLDDVAEPVRREIFNADRQLGLVSDPKLSELRLQLYLLGHVESSSEVIRSATLDFPTIVGQRRYLAHRIAQCFNEPGEQARYALALACRQGLVLKRLKDESCELRLMLPRAMLERLGSLRHRVGPSSRGNCHHLPFESRDKQVRFLAALARKYSRLRVKLVPAQDLGWLPRSYYIGDHGRGVVLSRAFFDRNYAAWRIDKKPARYKLYRDSFDQLWERAEDASHRQLIRYVALASDPP